MISYTSCHYKLPNKAITQTVSHNRFLDIAKAAERFVASESNSWSFNFGVLCTELIL